MDSKSEDVLTLSKLRAKVDATRSMLNQHLNGVAFSPLIWSDSDEDEVSCEEKMERTKRMIERMDLGDMKKLDGFSEEIDSQLNRIKNEASLLEPDQFEPKLEVVEAGMGETDLVELAECLQVRASKEESEEDSEAPKEFQTEINRVKGAIHIGTEVQQGELHTNSVGKSKNLQCTQGARQNVREEIQHNNVNCKMELLPVSLLDEIEASGESKPVSNVEKLDVEKASNEYIGNLNQVAKEKPKSYMNAVKGIKTNGKVGAEGLSFSRAGMELKQLPYVPKQGVPRIELDPDEQAMSKWKCCLVGYFLSEDLPYAIVRNEAFKLWGKHGLKRMSCTTTGFYFFEFSNDEDRNTVLENGLCYMFGKLLFLKKWHTMLSLTKSDMGKIPIWVRFFNLPYEFWSSINLSKIASVLGRPLYVDHATEKQLRVTYARICIEIDAFEEMHKFIEVIHGDQCVVVEVDYQGVPLKCNDCKVFGHDMNSCPVKGNEKKVNKDSNKYNQQFRPTKGVIPKWRAVKPATTEFEKGPTLKSDHRSGNFETFATGFLKPRSRNMIVKGRNGKETTLQEIKNSNVRLGKEKHVLKMANAFEILASSSDEGLVQKPTKNDATIPKGNLNSDTGKSHVKAQKQVLKVDIPTPKSEEGSDVNDANAMSSVSAEPTYSIQTKESNETKSKVEEFVGDLSVNKYAGNPEEDKSLFEAYLSEKDEGTQNVKGMCTPKKITGLSVSDYPSNMSMKQIKKRIKAVKNACALRKPIYKPP